ncbi:MAG: hypothetical protein ACE5DQ_01260 [Candidatus Paceibacterota bacterium]
MGGVAGGVLLYLFATGHGRQFLRNLIEIAEDLDGTIDDFEKHKKASKKGPSKGGKSSKDIHDILDKIQSAIPSKSEVKQYFAKDGKLLKS